ncbi:uncharacterized protein LOC115985026 [Quercus lobata]|uniref:uncharacterized protein LOC115985026 n=1 Tax=Quercus lobata TaxID=97700 RepID=UPI0012442E36|nr:uncharacterized protein LOC115985026 [Quercus lobata]
MLATLNRFISKFADRCRPFYQLLKKWKGFRWDERCDEAFQELKEYLAKAPRLTAPEPGEDLFMYLAVTEHAVSAVLLRDQGVQMPVYYVSKTLVDAETRYLPLEKLVLALVHATRKLPHYFRAHTVFVLTEYPLQSLLKRSDFTGRIAKWGTREAATVRLAEYQQKLAQRYNRNVKGREFSAGELVLRKVVGNMRDMATGKLAQTWEGPYRVTAIAGAGAYYMEDLDERPLPRPWNANNLKKFYA